MKKPKVSAKNAALLLGGIILFSQVSSLELPYLAREYLVLLVIKLYFATTYLIIPKLKQP
ncbi:MAG: hypothetical protein ACFB0D_15590 [Phormidesmis sp.]